jgi:hypothetical protein
MAQFDDSPPELVTRAGVHGFGIEMSIYPPDFEQLARATGAKQRSAQKRN